ncbi:divalent-cation tolerance protein CutA [Luteimonas salinilitoris]|uniref:Divalent-cation tolerance protein CutA n=1 Tax=Luteimonas salinilitoris TaxID=3237697 RepID=A0ABV4HV11_9GAMM
MSPLALNALICLCACPDRDVAARIAETLVGERLAACVNLLPGVTSVYRWQGTVERADEVLLLIKTAPARLQALTARIVALHPYELPEVIAVESAGGLPAYLDWIAQETSVEPQP